MYEELVKRLLSHAKLDREYNGSGKLFEDAADAIEGLLAVIQRQKEMINASAYLPLYPKPMKWIPVSEGLPEVGKKVLFSYRGCIKKQPRIFIGWYNGKQWDSLFGTEYDVTHWMPLPEPPKVDSNGQM